MSPDTQEILEHYRRTIGLSERQEQLIREQTPSFTKESVLGWTTDNGDPATLDPFRCRHPNIVIVKVGKPRARSYYKQGDIVPTRIDKSIEYVRIFFDEPTHNPYPIN